MSIDEIIGVLNQYINGVRVSKDVDKKSFLVLWKHTKDTHPVKMFKKMSYQVWLIDKEDKCLVTESFFLGRIIATNKDEISSQIEKKLLLQLFSIVNTPVFEDIINGTYGSSSID